MEDIAPELLEAILEEFAEGTSKSEILKLIKKKIVDGTATYAEANDLAIEVGEILSAAYVQNITADLLPDGRMYYNIANRVIPPTMLKGYEEVAGATEQIQQALNDQAHIGIKAIKPEPDMDRVTGIVNKVSHAEKFEDVAFMFKEPIKNFVHSVVDESIKSNAEFQWKAGMSPKIVRKSVGNCCEWCNRLVGTYRYPDVPKDVYRRHGYCRCTVVYNPGKGKVQNVHSREWIDVDERENMKLIGLNKISKEDKERMKTVGLGKSTSEEKERRKYIGIVEEEQEYRPIKRSSFVINSARGKIDIPMRRIVNSTYKGDMLISDSIELKPKQMHNIEKSLNNAVNVVEKEDNLPKCMIISSSEMQTGAICSYNATQNILYIDSVIGDVDKLLELQSEMACPENPLSTYVHELLHWKDAENYRQKKPITNQAEYLSELRSDCKKKLDKLINSGYNLKEIGEYAVDRYETGCYDETWTEYMVKILLEKGD